MEGYTMEVARSGASFFRTQRMPLTPERAGEVLAALQDKFPACEGYEVRCWCGNGTKRLIRLTDLP